MAILQRALTVFVAGLALGGLMKAQDLANLSISAKMDIYRAGGYQDGSDGIAPEVLSFQAKAGRTLSFASVNGEWNGGDGGQLTGPDGTIPNPCCPLSIPNPTGPFSGYSTTDFGGAMAGVFLEDKLPVKAAAPLRFYTANPELNGIKVSFPTISPVIGQVFFIGDGLTGTGIGSVQGFQVPPTATHLYLGYVDSCAAGGTGPPGCFNDNSGRLTAILHFQDHELDWVKSAVAGAPSGRCCAGMAYDAATSSTVLFGGGNGGISPRVRFGDTWVFSEGWKQRSPVISPSPRQGPGLAYDPTTQTAVLFGGGDVNGNTLADTWTWDGVTWTQQFPPISPPAREFDAQAMIYDPASGTVVLFGGGGQDGVLADTWEWNGREKSWTQRFPASSPTARTTSLTYDSASGNIVLFGGYNGAGDCCNTYFNDTWTWDGITWTQRFPAVAPSKRALPSIVYDTDLGQVVLFGGYSTPGVGLDDTWTWDGEAWTELAPTSTPGGRWALAAVDDPLAGGEMLFGGEITGDPFANDTWFFKFVPVR